MKCEPTLPVAPVTRMCRIGFYFTSRPPGLDVSKGSTIWDGSAAASPNHAQRARHSACDTLNEPAKPADTSYALRHPRKLLRLTEDSIIQDDQGVPVYQVKGKIFSLHHTLVLMDLAANELVTLKKQLISLTPKLQITRHGDEAATVRKKLISPFVDRFTFVGSIPR
jgi:hypothetical protein